MVAVLTRPAPVAAVDPLASPFPYRGLFIPRAKAAKTHSLAAALRSGSRYEPPKHPAPAILGAYGYSSAQASPPEHEKAQGVF
jgi:hypothetical protein